MNTPLSTLYRPSGANELALVQASNWKAWPPRLEHQNTFYPVLSLEYARRLARDFNAHGNNFGYVTQFDVKTEFLSRYPVRLAMKGKYTELRIPAAELAEFNTHIVGRIHVLEAYYQGVQVTLRDDLKG